VPRIVRCGCGNKRSPRRVFPFGDAPGPKPQSPERGGLGDGHHALGFALTADSMRLSITSGHQSTNPDHPDHRASHLSMPSHLGFSDQGVTLPQAIGSNPVWVFKLVEPCTLTYH